MKAIVRVDPTETQGLFSSKTKYSVFIQLHMSEEESTILAQYGTYTPRIYDYLEFNDDTKIEVAKKLDKRGGDRPTGFQAGITMEFDSVQQAGTYEDSVLAAFAYFRVQLDATRARASRLGEVREIEI